MADRRRQIEALRAKADSTTFPAEAAALRAKADELAAKEPQRPPARDAAANYEAWMTANGFRQPPRTTGPIHGQRVTYTVVDEVVDWSKVSFFEEMGGIRVTADNTNRVQVKNVNGQTYWITVE